MRVPRGPAPHLLPALLLALLPVAWASAQTPLTFTWHASLETIGTLASAGVGPAINSQDALSASFQLSHPAGQGFLTYRLSGQASYAPQTISPGSPSVSALTGYPTTTGITFELPPPRLIGVWLRASAGRVALDEPTGLLLEDPSALYPSQLADGLLVELRFKGLYGSLGAGYLGLLGKQLNRIRFTAQDAGELADSSVYFAPPRGLAVLRLETDNLLAGQAFGVEVIGQKDFRSGASTFDSWYLGLLDRGPMISAFSHESVVVAALSVPSDAAAGVGLLLQEKLAWRVPVRYLNEAWFSVLWASGPSGPLAAFPALAGPTVSDAFPAGLTDIVRLELGVNAALPAAPAGAVLSPGFTARLLLRPSQTQLPGYTFSLGGPYVGTELELQAALSPLDGIRFLARGGALIAAAQVLPYVRLEAGMAL
ncbi:MAG TPA: hypothetical protein VMM82_00905 [Spirochaetia bacterium]|nr:hypothetical protein [Spirochaetia bacterium]